MLSVLEEKELLRLLTKLTPGYYPLEIFWQMCRLNKLTAFEVIPFVRKRDDIFVLLTKRDDDDRFWPGVYHYSGCIIRATDTMDILKSRIIQEELGGVRGISDFKYVKTLFKQTERGYFIGYYHTIEIDESTISVGKLFNIKDILGNNLILKEQQRMIVDIINESVLSNE